MTDLKTNYMGIALKNPIVVGASNMVNDIENIKKLEKAGAAAIVYKSLFEEQIHLESIEMQSEMEQYNERHAEMVTLFPHVEHAGPKEHLLNLRKAKESVSIPVIASLNAIFKETWVEYAKQIEETGVDGLELNFYSVPREFDQVSAEIEKQQIEAFKSVKNAVGIPVSVKLSPFYANPLNFIKALDEAGADAFILFNRLFQPDIDIDAEKHSTNFGLSSPVDNQLPLRFAGLLYNNIEASIVSNSGIFTGNDVAKMILAGANAVQVVSTVYKNKIEQVSVMLDELTNWMEKKYYRSIDEFRGKLSNKSINDPFVYKRAQYVDILLKSTDITKKYPLR